MDGKKEIPVTSSRHWHWSADGNSWVVNFDPDKMKDQVHSGFLITPIAGQSYARGCVTLFGTDPQEHTDYAMHITAEEKVTEFVPGKGETTKWDKKRKANHHLDGAVGNKVARLVVKNWRLREELEEAAAASAVMPSLDVDPTSKQVYEMRKKRNTVEKKSKPATTKTVDLHRQCGICFNRLGGVGTAYSTKGMTTYYKCNTCLHNWSATTTTEATVIQHKTINVKHR